MTDRTKFEQMLEYLINEDKTKAEELFHELVVAKSREIYENLLDDDMDIEEEVEDEEDEEVTEEVSDEEADDMLDDLDGEGEEEGDEDEGEEEEAGDEDEEVTKGDLDLMKQDIIDALTAEFEQMMAGQEGAEEEGDMDMEMGAEEGGEEEVAAEMFGDDEMVMEYTQKVSANMGDNGANTKSAVAGKNDMGGTAANILKGGDGGTGGKAPTPKVDNAGNVNVPGAKASKSMTSAKKPAGGDNGANTKSITGA